MGQVISVKVTQAPGTCINHTAQCKVSTLAVTIFGVTAVIRGRVFVEVDVGTLLEQWSVGGWAEMSHVPAQPVTVSH